MENLLEIDAFRAFDIWKQAHARYGHTVAQANAEWLLRVGAGAIPFMALASVAVDIPEEARIKSNEVVFLRPDLQSVLAYRPADDIWETEIVLVKEFRSATRYGYVWELPSGSSFTQLAPHQVAQQEFAEETGLVIPLARFEKLDERQMLATLASHTSALYAVALQPNELEQLKQTVEARGNAHETERTYVEIATLREIADRSDIDWAMCGMIFSFFIKKNRRCGEG